MQMAHDEGKMRCDSESSSMPCHLEGWPLKADPNKSCGTFSQESLTQNSKTSGADVVHNLNAVRQRMEKAASKCCRAANMPELVAVSKCVPVELIQVAHNTGHKTFGENYVEELSTKAKLLPSDIKWHFMGHLDAQSARDLILNVPNVSVVESVDTTEVALALHTAVHGALQKGDRTEKLNIYLQVNTSGDSSLAGVLPDDVVSLARFVCQQCPALKVKGLMAIGGPVEKDCDAAKDFAVLRDLRIQLAQITNRNEEDLLLNMGISQDFEEAIKFGSNVIRIGTAIFGPRPAVDAQNVDENQREVEMREH